MRNIYSSCSVGPTVLNYRTFLPLLPSCRWLTQYKFNCRYCEQSDTEDVFCVRLYLKKTIIQTHTHKHNSISLPSMAQLGWALLFLLGSWSSVEEGLPLPRADSLPWDTLPWAPPLPGAEVAELLQGSPPSVRDALHSGPPTNSHQGSSGFTKVTGRSRLQMIKGDTHRSQGKGQTRTGKRAFRSFSWRAKVTFWVFSR